MPATAAPPDALSAHLSAPSHQRRKAERPGELLDAALALFVERGFAATKSEDVARRAGVSKGTLYLYYPSKEDLLKAVIEQYLGRPIAAGAERAASHAGSAAALLETVFVSYWVDLIEGDASGVFKLIITEVRNFPEIAAVYREAVVLRGEALVARIIERGIASGEFAPVNVAHAVHSLVLPMVMLCVHKHSVGACDGVQGLDDPRGFVAAHVRLVLQGLRPRTGPDVASGVTA